MAMANPIPTLPLTLASALSAYNRGKIAEAEQICREILTSERNSFGALHLFAIIQSRLGRNNDALSTFDQVLKIEPANADVFYNRGSVLRRLRRFDEALASYEKALKLEPNFVKALYQRGNTLRDLNQLEKALESYDQALAVQPKHPEALNNRGNVLKELSRFEEALASFDRALVIRPNYARALNNRGVALHELKRFADALTSYDRALAAQPNYVEALNNRGVTLHTIKRLEEALVDYNRALTLRPAHVEALCNRGNTLRELLRFKDAISTYERLLQVKPGHKYALGYLHHSKMRCCDWDSFGMRCSQITEKIRSGELTDQPFSFLAISVSPQDQLRCSQLYAAANFPAFSKPVWQGERYNHDKIRIAYVSADFHDHPMGYLMAALFEQHDHSRFETIAISFGPDSKSGMRKRLEQAFDRFIDVRQRSDAEVAALLRNLEIDIAVDRKGFTLDSRTGIFALRPAPIQVNYLAYPGTIGAEYIDYILADRIVVPEEHHSFFSEKIVYLPDTYQANDSKRKIAERTPTRSEVGLPARGFVYCCFNNSYKITPLVFDVWMRLLRAVEGSTLWLLRDNDCAEQNLCKEAAARGVDPARLVFATRLAHEDHLARHRLADLFLDTLPYNAHTTASDALWAGLPVLTCIGAAFPGRVAASLLNAVGMSELITSSLVEYEALALKLAREPDLLAEVKTKLACNRNKYPLYNTARFVRHVESAYTTMWEISQRGEPPRSFSVEPI